MKIHHVELSEELEYIYLVGISDLHIGDPLFDTKYFLTYRRWIESTPNCYVILNGDLLNTAIKNSVSDVYGETLTPQKQLDVATKLLLPIKDRILTANDGNHERRIYKEVGLNLSAILADKLGCHYSGDEAYLKITLGKGSNGKRIAYTVYATHGWSSARTTGSKMNTLESLGNIVLANIYFISHTHTPLVHKRPFFIPDIYNNNLIEVEQNFINTNAFMFRGGYAAAKGYPHSCKTVPRLLLGGREKKIEVTF